jgi:hypothetical protein
LLPRLWLLVPADSDKTQSASSSAPLTQIGQQ